MEVSAHVSFKGDCEAAFKCYEEVLGAKPGLLFRYADTPMADVVPEGWDSKIMHGSVRIGGKLLEVADVPPERYEKPQWFSLALNVPNAVEAERLFEDCHLPTIRRPAESPEAGSGAATRANLSLRDFVRMRDHGVTAGFARQLRSANGRLASVKDLIRRRDRGDY